MLSVDTARTHSDNRCSNPQLVPMARDSPSVGATRDAKCKSQFTQPTHFLRRQQHLNRFPGVEKCPMAEEWKAPCSK